MQALDALPAPADRSQHPSSRRQASDPSQSLTPPAGDGPSEHAGVAPGQRPAALGVSRFSPPVFRRGFVHRPRLVRRLLDERQASTAIVGAPAGYGKTSLLVEWTERDPRPCAWITLTDQHRQPAALVEAIMLALDELEPIDRRLLSKCRRAARHASAPSPELLGELATVVCALGSERLASVIVLDDAHLLRSRGTTRVLSAVAAAMPSCAKLALASRTEPALQLGRLRADGKLLQLGPRDLAMTAYEAHKLLRASGLRLDRGSVDRLVTMTEGWPAALYLAGLTLSSHPDLESALERHGGAERTISDYVQQEVLKPLGSELRAFLRRSSVLAQLNAPLCDAALERSDSARVLEALTFQGLLVPLDGNHQWHRCHSLVRVVLRSELDAGDSHVAARLCSRSSYWFEECGDIETALDYAVAAANPQRVGELLWRHAPTFLMRGRDPRVLRWLSAFPEEQIVGSPQLALCAAFNHLGASDLDEAERWATAASDAVTRTPPEADQSLQGGIALIHAIVGDDGVERMATLAGEAEVLLERNSPWRSVCCLLQGVAHHVCGRRTQARHKLEQGVSVSTTAMPLAEGMCAAQLAMIDAEDGNWGAAADRIEAAERLVSSQGLADQPLATLVFAASAWIAGRRGLGDRAKRDLTRATQLLDQCEGLMTWYEVEAHVLIARASIRLADVPTARASLSQASRALRRLPDAPELHSWLDGGWADVDEHSASTLTGPASLTIAELRILRFLPTHLSFREIGERLHVSTNTVKTQAHAVYGKLGAASRSEAVANANTLGLIEASIV